ncbi:MAG: SPFH domain-containing protein [Firmicutes bacterium]|nr:SPFH domain-containing protein [Bacillota bacterium]
MGFIKAFGGALSGTFADQWKDFYVPRPNVPATAALFQAVPQGTNAGRGENYKGSENIITNGSKIVVPEGMALITLQDGAITGMVAEPGGFIYQSDDPNSKSIFSGGGLLSATIGQSWERFKFGGQPGAQQTAFYVNLKLIVGNKFGTASPIYWNDEFLGTKAGASARGTYSLKITDPILFIKNFVPMQYLQPNAPVFDFADIDNPCTDHLFNDFLTCLTGAFKRFSLESRNNGEGLDTLDYVQANLPKFAQTMDEEVENNYQWSTNYGLKVESVNLITDYDGPTQEILEEARKADQEVRKATRMGQAYGNNMAGMMAAASGQAMQNAAANENGAMMGFMGMNMAQQGGVNLMGAVNNMQQPQQYAQPAPAPQPVQQPAAPAEDPYAKLTELKKLLDAGVITQADFDAAKNKILGI